MKTLETLLFSTVLYNIVQSNFEQEKSNITKYKSHWVRLLTRLFHVYTFYALHIGNRGVRSRMYPISIIDEYHVNVVFVLKIVSDSPSIATVSSW